MAKGHGVSLTALAARRAMPPPFVADVAAVLLRDVTSAAALGAAVGAAAHPSRAQAIEQSAAAMLSLIHI